MNQQTIFDVLYSKYKIDKPIRLIELFAGYGSQALALKYLGVDFEHWKICEWAIKSIQAYKDIHFTDDNTNYSKDLTKENIIDILHYLGISSNYNEPMTLEQIKRLNEPQLRNIYNNIVATNNLVNIQKVKGKDLEIKDTDKYAYIMTYSFPCQDLSLAGKGKGMSDTSTRSGMLWEVERILGELENKPQILLMENVPQVHSVDNVEDFKKWILRLEELGYSNYFEDLIATNYGIPQTRNRCFMISILGEYSYSFPAKQELKLKLKDLLEPNVDEKYYLSDKMKEYIFSENNKYKVNPNSMKINREIACSKTTREGSSRADTSDYITDEVIGTYDEYNHKFNNDETIGTIQAMYSTQNHGHRLLIKNANSKGYLEATEGDGVDISSRMEYHRGTVQKDKSQTLTTMGGENQGVVVDTSSKIRQISNELIKNNKIQENDVTLTNYVTRRIKDDDFIQNNNITPTLTTTTGEIGAAIKDQLGNLRIRKLTPKECFRLMGVKDEDFEKCAKNQSNASLYHLAGDSIVVNVLMAIFKELL